jgi:hypothetical protein
MTVGALIVRVLASRRTVGSLITDRREELSTLQARSDRATGLRQVGESHRGVHAEEGGAVETLLQFPLLRGDDSGSAALQQGVEHVKGSFPEHVAVSARGPS